MLSDEIQAGFPGGVTVPDDLRRFLEFAEENGREVSGCFEFETDGRAAALAWFGDEAPASQFAVFGRGPDGSLYALWLYPGRGPSDAPVVLLDSESDGNQVIAAGVRDFLRLLAIGYDEPGRYPTLEPEDPESARGLREWLSEEFGLGTPGRAGEIVDEAKRQHPDLGSWVRDWQQKKGG
jgi:hypothetical protein